MSQSRWDREERPDVDKIYMDASYLMTGRGGWPLNVIAMPDGRPIFAGTYFPKSDWLKILEHIVGQYEEDPERLNEIADKITQGIQTIETVELNTSRSEISMEELNDMHSDFISEIDLEKGGRKGVEKFPTPIKLEISNETLLFQQRPAIIRSRYQDFNRHGHWRHL